MLKSQPHPRVTMYQRGDDWTLEPQTFLSLDGLKKHPLIYILGGKDRPVRAFEYVYPAPGPGVKKLSEELNLHGDGASHEEAAKFYVEYVSKLPEGYQTQHQGGTGGLSKTRRRRQGDR